MILEIDLIRYPKFEIFCLVMAEVLNPKQFIIPLILNFNSIKLAAKIIIHYITLEGLAILSYQINDFKRGLLQVKL